jgi:hypothetical protein
VASFEVCEGPLEKSKQDLLASSQYLTQIEGAFVRMSVLRFPQQSTIRSPSRMAGGFLTTKGSVASSGKWFG